MKKKAGSHSKKNAIKNIHDIDLTKKSVEKISEEIFKIQIILNFIEENKKIYNELDKMSLQFAIINKEHQEREAILEAKQKIFLTKYMPMFEELANLELVNNQLVLNKSDIPVLFELIKGVSIENKSNT